MNSNYMQDRAIFKDFSLVDILEKGKGGFKMSVGE